MKEKITLILRPAWEHQTRRRNFSAAKICDALWKEYPYVTAHWHEEAEFTWIRSGACVYHIDLCDYPVQEGDMILLPPRILHSSGFFPRDHMMSESFVFHLDFLGMGGSDVCSVKYLRPFASREIVFPYVFQADHPANPLLRDMMRQLSDEYISHGDGYELRMKALFLELFSRICLTVFWRTRRHPPEIRVRSSNRCWII